MDTVIHLREPLALDGQTPEVVVTIPDSKYKIDESGTLHVHYDPSATRPHTESSSAGVVSFNSSDWRAVLRGDVAFDDAGYLNLVTRTL